MLKCTTVGAENAAPASAARNGGRCRVMTTNCDHLFAIKE